MNLLDKVENIVKEEGLILIVSEEMKVKRMGPFIQVMVGRVQEMIITLDEEDKGFEKIVIMFKKDSNERGIPHSYDIHEVEKIRVVVRKKIKEIINRSGR